MFGIKMIVVITYLMCGIVHIMGRPNSGFNQINSNQPNQIPAWPQCNNTYLLPKKLKVNDIINVTAVILNTPVLGISLMTDVSASTNSSKAICNFWADTLSGTVDILDDDGKTLIQDDDYIDAQNFYNNGDPSIFNVWFKRRSNDGSQNHNILVIESKTYSTEILLHEVDNLRFLKFSGDNVKVTELEFKFAV